MWTKRCPSSADAAREAAGLRWLASAPGGPRVVRVHAVDGDRLDLERILTTRATREAARVFGVDLAHLHAAGAPFWGAPPPGSHGDGTIGTATLTTPPRAPVSWGAFYARDRVLPHLERALAVRAMTASEAAVVRALAQRLEAGELDHAQPALVAAGGVARLHGDLWSGNVLWTAKAEGADVEAVLIDPAAQGGHAETDLAMLALFGAPFLEEIVAAYGSESPLAAGWRDRVALHQVHPLLVHAELFGGGYGREAAAAASRYV